MKLSEAILRGSTMLAAQAGGQYFPETKSGCALGMAAIAKGCSFRTVTRPVSENERRTLGVEGVWGQWVLRVVMRPCECWELRVPPAMRIKDIIAHLFDFHVMKKKNWTLERLAGWVETWEPKEIRVIPFASALLPGKPVLPKPRVDHPTEQQWQQFREAFEARRKTRRSTPENFPRDLSELNRADESDQDEAPLS